MKARKNEQHRNNKRQLPNSMTVLRAYMCACAIARKKNELLLNETENLVEKGSDYVHVYRTDFHSFISSFSQMFCKHFQILEHLCVCSFFVCYLPFNISGLREKKKCNSNRVDSNTETNYKRLSISPLNPAYKQ